MVFQNSFSRNSTALDLANRPPIILPTNRDPINSLKKNIIKPQKDFTKYDKQPSTTISRSINMFQTGMIQNVNGPIKNCSSCGGAK